MRTIYEAYKNRIRNERLFHLIPIRYRYRYRYRGATESGKTCVPQPPCGMSYLFYLPLAPHLEYTRGRGAKHDRMKSMENVDKGSI